MLDYLYRQTHRRPTPANGLPAQEGNTMNTIRTILWLTYAKPLNILKLAATAIRHPNETYHYISYSRAVMFKEHKCWRRYHARRLDEIRHGKSCLPW